MGRSYSRKTRPGKFMEEARIKRWSEKRQMTETEYVKRAVAALRRRRPHNQNNRYLLYAVEKDGELFGGDRWWSFGKEAALLRDRLARRIFKKLGQPFRKNMRRKHMRRKAAGKNEVTRRR